MLTAILNIEPVKILKVPASKAVADIEALESNLASST